MAKECSGNADKEFLSLYTRSVFLRFQSGKLVFLCSVFKVSSCQKPKSGTYLFIQDIVWLGITHRVCWWARLKYFSAQEGAFLLAIIKFDYGVCVSSVEMLRNGGSHL